MGERIDALAMLICAELSEARACCTPASADASAAPAWIGWSSSFETSSCASIWPIFTQSLSPTNTLHESGRLTADVDVVGRRQVAGGRDLHDAGPVGDRRGGCRFPGVRRSRGRSGPGRARLGTRVNPRGVLQGTGAAPGPSFGLGLAISRHAVEAHGGRVVARNREGGGLVVEIGLPVVA